jgi:hypothetical protein
VVSYPRLSDGYRPEMFALLHAVRLPSADGFHSVEDLRPAPQPASSDGLAAARPAPWLRQASQDYQSRLLAGQLPPLPRALSEQGSRAASPARAASKTPPARRSHGRETHNSASSSPRRHMPDSPSSRFGPYTRDQASSRRSRSEESGMSHVYGRHRRHVFPPVEDAVYAPFFQELSEDRCSWGVGMLQRVRERDEDDILVGAFLKDGPVPHRLAAGVNVVEGGLQGRPGDQENTLGVREFVAVIRSIKDLAERDRAILTGVHRGATLVLDWRKDALAVEEDWLEIGMDIDSLSLTVNDPHFTTSVSIQTYPARATTMTSDNRLRVDVNGVETPLSHCTSPSML